MFLLVNYLTYKLVYVIPSFLRWIFHDIGSNRFNTTDFQLGVLAKRSVTESTAYPFVRSHHNHTAPAYMYGLEVHHNHERAMELDVLINGLGHKSNAHPPDGYEARGNMECRRLPEHGKIE